MNICLNCKNEMTEFDLQCERSEFVRNGVDPDEFKPDEGCSLCADCVGFRNSKNNFINNFTGDL